MCFSPQRRAIFRQLNVRKCSEDYSFLTFWLSNVLFATAACNFSTSEQTKVVQTCGVLYILTFRHSGVQFFDIWTDKRAPKPSCFVHFDFQMCFSPQRRAIFRHPNFKKWSKHAVFCTFWLANVLFATAACNFSTSEQTKVLRSRRVLYILTFKCAFRHSGVQFLMSPLSTYLRTRRFNRPTFGLTRHTNLWKNTAFRDFSNIWRGCIFFLLTFWLLHLLSTDLTTLLLLFNSPYCRKFLFKLPSIIVSSKLLKQVRFVGQRKSWWFSFNPCEKVMCVKHGNLPQRGAVEHQKNTFERENSCTMKSSAAPTVHKWHPSRTAPRRCWWTWKNVGQKSWKWQEPWQMVHCWSLTYIAPEK